MAYYGGAYIRNAGRLASQDDGIVGNIIDGAQYGYSPHLEMLDASTPLVLPPMRPIVTHTPDQFKYIPRYQAFFKAFFERHVHTFDGVDLQYTNQGFAMAALADGQTPHAPSDTKRADITPTAACQEVIGNVCWETHHRWLITNKDPDTQGAPLSGLVPSDQPLPPHVFSTWSMDILCIQPDTTFRPENLVSGYFVTAMTPTDIGVAHFRREVGTSTLPERQFTYEGVLQHNYNTVAVAREVMGLLRMHIPNADYSVPVARTIEDALLNEGTQLEIANAITNYAPISATQS